MADLHVLREENLRNIPATLRSIAEGIESGRYGDAKGCALVLDAEQVEVFFSGSAAHPGATTVLLLATAQAKIVNGVLDIKNCE